MYILYIFGVFGVLESKLAFENPPPALDLLPLIVVIYSQARILELDLFEFISSPLL